MHDGKIAEYRTTAAVCIKWAESETKKSRSLPWRKLAEHWIRKAAALEKKIKPSAQT